MTSRVPPIVALPVISTLLFNRTVPELTSNTSMLFIVALNVSASNTSLISMLLAIISLVLLIAPLTSSVYWALVLFPQFMPTFPPNG